MVYTKMPARRVTRRAPRKNLSGKGFLDVMSKIGNFFKDSKIISTVASLIPHAGAQGVARVAGAVGLGRRRAPKRRTQRGGSMVLNNSMHGMRRIPL